VRWRMTTPPVHRITQVQRIYYYSTIQLSKIVQIGDTAKVSSQDLRPEENRHLCNSFIQPVVSVRRRRPPSVFCPLISDF
jgi:hypothetical protein